MNSETSWRAVAIFVLFLIVAVFLGYRALNKTEGSHRTITNADFNFSVDYPVKWNARTHGETGFKGERDIRLRIYRSALNSFRISVHQQPAQNPSIDDVVEWGSHRIGEIDNYLSKRGDPELTEIFFQKEDMVGEKTIARRRYAGNGIIYEDVYIARGNDMIIIILQAPEEYFESYLDDFDAIVNSFRPKE